MNMTIRIFVKQRLVFAALAMLTLSVPASAEPLRLAQAEAGVLPPREILDILRSDGFDPLGRPVRRGPNYVLRAVDDTDREVSVVVNARSGDILSVTPVRTASRIPPVGGVTARERMAPGYVPPGAYRGAPMIIEDDEPIARPPAPVPSRPSGFVARPPAPGYVPPSADDDGPVSGTIRSTELPPPSGQQQGLLPPPPERFPQRAAPAAAPKPKPVQRAAAPTPKQTPLPKPRPGANMEAPQDAPSVSQPAAVPSQRSDDTSVPH